MATGNITRLEGVWPETHERAVRDSAGVNLETKLGNINSNIRQLDQEVEEIKGLRISTATADFSIEDGDGNILAQFADGHIKTKNFDSSEMKPEDVEDVDFSLSDANGNTALVLFDGHIKTKNFDSSKILPAKKTNQRETYFKTKVDCVQMNASSYDATDPNSYVSQAIYDDNAVLILPESYTPQGKPTRLIIYCKQGNRQITDSSNPIFESNNMGNIFHFLVTRGYAVLAADGVPDGLSSALGLDDTRVSGSYAAVQSTRKAYDYVIENYNIDTTGAFIFGYSQGGIYAQNVIDLSGIPIIGCAMVSPTLSMRYHLWDLSTSKTIDGVDWTRTSRLNIARLFGFPTVTTNSELLALQFDKEKVAGYDPWYRNVENPYEGFVQPSAYGSTLWALPSGTILDNITMKKKIGCPTKIWVAENDSTLGADVTKVFVKACRNAGQVCDLHLYNAGSHYIYQNSYQSPAISQFSDQGMTYNLFPIAYEIASFFFRLGGLPLATD